MLSSPLLFMTEYTKSHGLELYLKNAPSKYPMTVQQKKMRLVAEKCGIKTGIKKAELMTKMKECVGPKMREKNAKND